MFGGVESAWAEGRERDQESKRTCISLISWAGSTTRDALPPDLVKQGSLKLGPQVESRRHSLIWFRQENTTFNALPTLAALQTADMVRGEGLPRGQAGCSECPPPHPYQRSLLRKGQGSGGWGGG